MGIFLSLFTHLLLQNSENVLTKSGLFLRMILFKFPTKTDVILKFYAVDKINV